MAGRIGVQVGIERIGCIATASIGLLDDYECGRFQITSFRSVLTAHNRQQCKFDHSDSTLLLTEAMRARLQQ